MKLNFSSETYAKLLEKANAEGTSIPNYIRKTMESILDNEETNNNDKPEPKER